MTNIETILGANKITPVKGKYTNAFGTTYVLISNRTNKTITFGVGTMSKYVRDAKRMDVYVDTAKKLMYFIPTNDGAFMLTQKGNSTSSIAGASVFISTPKIKSWKYEPVAFFNGGVSGFYIQYTED